MRVSTACKSLSLVCLATLMAACASAPQGSAPPAHAGAPGTVASPRPATSPPQLAAHDWDLVAMSDREGRSDTRWRAAGQRAPRLHFEDGRVSLHNLCNVVSSSYQLQGSALQLAPGVSTRRACADPALTALEQRMTAALAGSVNYEVRNNAGGPPLLVLHFNDGSRWELTGTPTPQSRLGGPGERVFLEIAPQRVPCGDGSSGARCLQVRDVRFADNGTRQGVGAWQTLQGEIEGYRHEPGVRNVVRLHRYPQAQAPAGAPVWTYVADTVVETERMR